MWIDARKSWHDFDLTWFESDISSLEGSDCKTVEVHVYSYPNYSACNIPDIP